jgi:hypothetical protein
MAQLSGSNAGCGWLIVLIVLGFLLAYWPLFLVLALLFLGIVFGINAVMEQDRKQLQLLVELADRRVRNDPCQVQDCFGVIHSISLASDLATPRLDIRCWLLVNNGGQLEGEDRRISLSPPAERQQLRTGSGVRRLLAAGGITQLEDLSVEAKATRAAMDCLRERAWTQDALTKLKELKGSVIATLAKAEGNELLEPAIPQLQEALRVFKAEQTKLRQATSSSNEMLRKLHDFLSVPEAIRSILNFDLDQLYDPSRFAELEQSFSELVVLNETFHELSREALA